MRDIALSLHVLRNLTHVVSKEKFAVATSGCCRCRCAAAIRSVASGPPFSSPSISSAAPAAAVVSGKLYIVMNSVRGKQQVLSERECSSHVVGFVCVVVIQSIITVVDFHNRKAQIQH